MSERLKLGVAFLATLAGVAYFWFAWISPGLGRAGWSYYIIPGLAGVLYLFAWAALIRRWFVQIPKEDLLKALEASPPSFSVILFHGASTESVAAWLESVGFAILRAEKRSGPYQEVAGALAYAHSYHRPKVFWMATLHAGDHAVLMDVPHVGRAPSMDELEAYYSQGPETLTTGLAFADDWLAGFCKEHSTMATVARWDRLTASVVLRDFAADGLREQTVFFGGERVEWEEDSPYSDVREDSQLAESPNADGLLHALGRRGVDVGALFGEIEATALELETSAVDQPAQASNS